MQKNCFFECVGYKVAELLTPFLERETPCRISRSSSRARRIRYCRNITRIDVYTECVRVHTHTRATGSSCIYLSSRSRADIHFKRNCPWPTVISVGSSLRAQRRQTDSNSRVVAVATAKGGESAPRCFRR